MQKPLMQKKNSNENHLSPSRRRGLRPFLCKPGCSANEAAAQAGRGALRAIGSFTDCKILKRSAVRLHSGAADNYERVRAGGPGFIGSKILKHLNQAVFRIATGRKCTLLQVQGVSQDMQGVARRLGLAG